MNNSRDKYLKKQRRLNKYTDKFEIRKKQRIRTRRVVPEKTVKPLTYKLGDILNEST